MSDLTSEQQVAVTSRDGSYLLAAGAGSGKTTVLVERFVRYITEDAIAVDRVAAITFTENRCRFFPRSSTAISVCVNLARSSTSSCIVFSGTLQRCCCNIFTRSPPFCALFCQIEACYPLDPAKCDCKIFSPAI